MHFFDFLFCIRIKSFFRKRGLYGHKYLHEIKPIKVSIKLFFKLFYQVSWVKWAIRIKLVLIIFFKVTFGKLLDILK